MSRPLRFTPQIGETKTQRSMLRDVAAKENTFFIGLEIKSQDSRVLLRQALTSVGILLQPQWVPRPGLRPADKILKSFAFNNAPAGRRPGLGVSQIEYYI